ncbi:Uncharacterised protein [Alloiococcus otitis]|uniref:Uncharacterized protein n=1 Tax=Alloiococcus otitis ATCC 51267 TaxID=883081 RepID=K9EBQ6_9LACT|nr:hypothetical protein HMPREF9698_00425 [Alloiococcus otitis ATCC 51267]SUU80973.1 Uncharacterised protein [Alloiococcus otitis]
MLTFNVQRYKNGEGTKSVIPEIIECNLINSETCRK